MPEPKIKHLSKTKAEALIISYKGYSNEKESIPKKAVFGSIEHKQMYTLLTTLEVSDANKLKFVSKPISRGALMEKDIAYCYKILLAKHQDKPAFNELLQNFMDQDKERIDHRKIIAKFKADLPNDLNLRSTCPDNKKVQVSESKEKFSPAMLVEMLVELSNEAYEERTGIEGAFNSIL